MERPDSGLMTVEAELRVPSATAQVARFHLTEPGDFVFQREEAYWLDLCLTPRPENARACYRDHWGPHRFERIGDVFLVPPGQALHTRSDGGREQTSIVCQLCPERIGEWFEDEIDWTDRKLEASLDIPNGHIRTLLGRLAEESRHPGFGSEVLVELIVGQIAIELARYCAAVADGPVTGGLAAWRLRLIDERLREVRDPPTLTELAELCNLSIRQLTRGFRASRGCSIGDWVTQVRIDGAKRLLASGQSIKSIAYEMGFSSTSSFSFAFRRATGSTPRQFRQRLHPAVARPWVMAGRQ